MWIVMIVAAVLVIAILAFSVRGYNLFIRLKNRVENQAAQIDVQLKRRADLIPNLVEVTKKYAAYEKDTLSEVTKLRSVIANPSDTAASYRAGEKLSKAARQMIAIGEQYPDLKANANFLRLQADLAETEDKVSIARQFYNDTVMKYNTAVMMFPNSVLAGIFGFSKMALLEASDAERSPVKISEL